MEGMLNPSPATRPTGRTATVPDSSFIRTQKGGMTIAAGDGAEITIGNDSVVNMRGDLRINAGPGTLLVARPEKGGVRTLVAGQDFPAGEFVTIGRIGEVLGQDAPVSRKPRM